MRNPWPLKIEASCLSKEYQTYLDPFELQQQKYNLFELIYRSIFKQDMLQNKTKAWMKLFWKENQTKLFESKVELYFILIGAFN